MLRLARGFTLIEVLITLVVLSFGLLGLAGLVIKGHRASYEAYQRRQALTIASDLVERIKANEAMMPSAAISPPTPDNLTIANAYASNAPLAAPLGNPTNPAKWNALMVSHSTPDCNAVVCTHMNLVDYDLGIWEGELLGVSENLVANAGNIGGIVNARGCVEGPLASPSPPHTYRVSVSWQGDVPTSAPTSTRCGAGLYRNAATGQVDEATRRVVSLDVTIFVPL